MVLRTIPVLTPVPSIISNWYSTSTLASILHLHIFSFFSSHHHHYHHRHHHPLFQLNWPASPSLSPHCLSRFPFLLVPKDSGKQEKTDSAGEGPSQQEATLRRTRKTKSTRTIPLGRSLSSRRPMFTSAWGCGAC